MGKPPAGSISRREIDSHLPPPEDRGCWLRSIGNLPGSCDFPPQTLEFLFLQDAEQFGLQGGSDLADLVEEQSTLIR